MKSLGPLVDLEAALPALAGMARTAVRLHPRPTDRDLSSESNWGGGFVWPPSELVPELTFVAQILKRDVPEIAFPDGADLLQVFWKAELDELWDDPPPVAVFWGNSEGRVPRMTETESWRDREMIPAPCELFPERIVEYPHWLELDPSFFRDASAFTRFLRDPLLHEARRANSLKDIYSYNSCAPGTKALGWPDWIQSPSRPVCELCSGPTRHLLTIASCEFELETRWQTGDPDSNVLANYTGLMLGDLGNVYLFYCEACGSRPVQAISLSS